MIANVRGGGREGGREGRWLCVRGESAKAGEGSRGTRTEMILAEEESHEGRRSSSY
jgi:hypothetical protein